MEPQIQQIAVFVANERQWMTAPHHSEWSWQIVHALEQELFNAGFSLTVISPPSVGGEAESGISLEQRLERLGRTLCGAVCFSCPGVLEMIEQLQQRDVPWVAINRPGRQINHNYVSAANQQGGWTVGRLFALSGLERVLLLSNNAARFASDTEKMTGMFQGYIESGMPTGGLQLVGCDNFFEMDGYRATRAALEEGFRPQGVFASGDMLAAGAIHALRDAGLGVPEEVSVVGATGLERSAQYDPPLSVIAQPMEQMGRAAGQMLREMIAEKTRRYAPRRIECPLILRGSTNVTIGETNGKLGGML
jgi:LacI family transcriptional regulator